MSTPLETLNQKRSEVVGNIDALKAKVASENRVEFNDEEASQLDVLVAQAEHLSNQIDRYKKTESISASMSVADGRQVQTAGTSVTAAVRPVVTGGTGVSATFANHGFTRGFSEFLGAVKNAAYGRTDQRLLNAITTYGSENVGPDGGFAVPQEFATRITEVVVGEDSLVSKFNPIMTAGNQVVLPTDETTPYGSSGIYGEWLGEASAMTDRKPALNQITVSLQKVGVMVSLSDELASDAPAVQTHVMSKVAQTIAAKVNEALVNGNGVAKPLGLLNAPGLVSQAKSGATLAAVDLANMLSRMVPQSLGNSFWLVHSSFLPKVWSLTIGNFPAFVPDYRVSPYGTILGRPVFVTEYAQDYNTKGDVMLVSPDGYIVAMKSAGIQTSASIHWAFNQDLQTFKATLRIGGTPLAKAAIARKNGSTTLAHIITLDPRN